MLGVIEALQSAVGNGASRATQGEAGADRAELGELLLPARACGAAQGCCSVLEHASVSKLMPRLRQWHDPSQAERDCCCTPGHAAWLVLILISRGVEDDVWMCSCQVAWPPGFAP